MGARYEKSIAPKPSIVNPDWPQTGHIDTGSLNLAPRFGVAYRLNDKTVVRGGFGTYFARLVSGMVEDVLIGQGMFQSSVSLTATSAPQLRGRSYVPERSGRRSDGCKRFGTQPSVHSPESEDALLRAGFDSGGAADSARIWSSPPPACGAME